MKILALWNYYLPEQYSSAALDADLFKGLCERGHEVELIVPMPTRGISEQARNACPPVEEKYGDRMTVRRFKMYREGRNPLLRALRYTLCILREYRIGKGAENIDLILAVSTPPIQGMMSVWVKKKLKVPFVYWLEDIFPDSLVNTRLAKKDSILWKIGRRIENYIYKNADGIITISSDFKQNLLEKKVPADKVHVIYNWLNANGFHVESRESNPLFDELSLSREAFYVIYAGRLSYSHNPEQLYTLAEELIKRKSDVRLLIFSEGAGMDLLQRKMKESPLDNMHLFAMQPSKRAGCVYAMGNAGLVLFGEKGLKCSLPSKAWSTLAAGAPVISVGGEGGELERILNSYCCGISVPFGQVEVLADAIMKMRTDPVSCMQMGKNGQKFSLEHLDAESAINAYQEVLASVRIGGDRGAAIGT